MALKEVAKYDAEDKHNEIKNVWWKMKETKEDMNKEPCDMYIW